ncbi:cytochrome-c peroxidase [Vibrio sinaloensis]|nr:cytochrome-c peroxidase [Vibrio sinaloensis]
MLILAATVSLSFSTLSQAQEPTFGPLPEMKNGCCKKQNWEKRLFFDTRLSGNTSLSCASCHQPDNGYSYPEALSPAYTGSKGFRNVPTLINTVYKKRSGFMMDVSGPILMMLRVRTLPKIG